MTADDLASIFLSARPPGQHPTGLGTEELEAVLGEVMRRARSAWPDIDISAEQFLPYLAERWTPAGDPQGGGQDVNIEDLFLAHACSMGHAHALTFFKEVYFPEIEHALHAVRVPPGETGDLTMAIFEKLAYSKDGRRPRITYYEGRGDLVTWIRVIAMRQAIDVLRRDGKMSHLEDVDLQRLVSSEHDPELACLKRQYRESFKEAFQGALAALGDRERTILRYYLVDRLNIEQIGSIYRVHRSTVARWIGDIRERLSRSTREALARCLRLSPRDFESMMVLIQSELNVSMTRLLRQLK